MIFIVPQTLVGLQDIATWFTGHWLVVQPVFIMKEFLYPKWNRFWEICEKHKVNQFYTAPTAIRAIAQHPAKLIEDYDLSALKVLGSVENPLTKKLGRGTMSI